MQAVDIDILIIEDDDDIRQVFLDILEGEGYRVATATNGAEGLSALQNGYRPWLILLDLVMPVMNGAEFLAHRQTDDRLASIPVVLLSGGDQSMRRDLPAVDMVVGKPVALEALLAAIERFSPRALAS